jgi:hypothetical protein
VTAEGDGFHVKNMGVEMPVAPFDGAESAGAGGGATTVVKLQTVENGPVSPSAFAALTRQ